MRKHLLARLSEERGIAMITALLVSMVIVSLGVTSVSIAVHNSESSAYDRRRVTNIAAAEAGVDYYFSHLQSATSASSMQCSISRNMNTSPVTSFDASVTFYDAAGTEMACPPPADPATALIESVGQTNLNTTPQRTMQAYVRLTPRPGNPFGTTAIFSNSSIDWGANVTIQGEIAGNSNIYSNGDVNLNSSTVIYGSVYAQGAINLRGNVQVRRDAWSYRALSMRNASSVLGNGMSSTSSVTLQNSARIGQDAQAGTSISAGSNAIGGVRRPNSPQGAPPVTSFPSYTFNAADWTGSGYTVQTFTGSSACTNAKNFIRNSLVAGSSYVVRIEADCTLSWNRDVPAIAGNLAIISDGGMSVGNQTRWAPASGQEWGLFLIFGVDDASSPCNITWGPGSRIEPGLTLFMYTPCTIDASSNVYFNEGQVFGGTVRLSANTGIKYKQVGLPGHTNEAYDEDVLYIREIITGS